MSFRTMENVSRNDVVNIIESIQQCYEGYVTKNSVEEMFLVRELQEFINGLRCDEESLEIYLDAIEKKGGEE